MSLARGTALAIALLTAALAIAGCGVGAGDEVGTVSLTVTRDFGAEPIAGSASASVSEADTIMRLLDREFEVETSYGGRFVDSIDGLEGGREGGRPHDWFFYVNGLWSPFGAAEYPLRGGDEVWWDYRDWSASTRVSAVVGSWPQPFADGYEGARRPTAVECLGVGAACAGVRQRLRAAGATLVGSDDDEASRVLVGPWARLRDDSTAAKVEAGPEASGVYADFERRGEGFALLGLDEGGESAHRFGPGAGLVAATRRFEAPPVWLVTGGTGAAVRAAAGLLDRASLRDHYAVAIEGGEATPLPVRRP